MTQWFIAYVLCISNSVFSPGGMQPVYDRAECEKIGDAFVTQMESKGYRKGATESNEDNSWASYHCIELPYNGKL